MYDHKNPSTDYRQWQWIRMKVFIYPFVSEVRLGPAWWALQLYCMQHCSTAAAASIFRYLPAGGI